MNREHIEAALDWLYKLFIDIGESIGRKLTLLELLDSLIDQRDSVFINRFISHKLYRLLVKYAKYENPDEPGRFCLLYSEQTADLELYRSLYDTCVLLFAKWNRDLGTAKSQKTPFSRNYTDLRNQNAYFRRFIERVEALDERIGWINSQANQPWPKVCSVRQDAVQKRQRGAGQGRRKVISSARFSNTNS